jgi:PKD repeat protein
MKILKALSLMVIISLVFSGGNAAADDSPPLADFTVSPASGAAPLMVTLDASGSRDEEGSITDYRWSFGDGSGSSVSAPFAEYTYTDSGTYRIVLTVTDDEGQTGTFEQTITVTPGDTGAENAPPTADFTIYPETGPAPLSVALDASKSNDADGWIDEYKWSFGDGEFATEIDRFVNHIFQIQGNYTVTLTVTDDDGATDSVQKTVPVTSGEASLIVTLPDDAQEGDGTIAKAGKVSVNYAPAASLTVSLISNDISEAAVPVSATISAGQTSANFDIIIQDDTASDGTQIVSITASASGYVSGAATMKVYDNDKTDANQDGSDDTSTGGGGDGDTNCFISTSAVQ